MAVAGGFLVMGTRPRLWLDPQREVCKRQPINGSLSSVMFLFFSEISIFFKKSLKNKFLKNNVNKKQIVEDIISSVCTLSLIPTSTPVGWDKHPPSRAEQGLTFAEAPKEAPIMKESEGKERLCWLAPRKLSEMQESYVCITKCVMKSEGKKNLLHEKCFMCEANRDLMWPAVTQLREEGK